MDIAGAGQIAGAEQRQRVQNLLVQDGLHCSQEFGILNRSNSCLLKLLESITGKNGELAPAAELEPALPP